MIRRLPLHLRLQPQHRSFIVGDTVKNVRPKYMDTHRMFFVKTALQQKPFLSFLSSSQNYQESTTHRHFGSTITQHGAPMVFYNMNTTILHHHGDPTFVQPPTVATNVARSLQQQQQQRRTLSLSSASFLGKSSFRLLPSLPSSSSSSQQIRTFANRRVSAPSIVLYMRQN
jgi:hypothetical protein